MNCCRQRRCRRRSHYHRCHRRCRRHRHSRWCHRRSCRRRHRFQRRHRLSHCCHYRRRRRKNRHRSCRFRSGLPGSWVLIHRARGRLCAEGRTKGDTTWRHGGTGHGVLSLMAPRHCTGHMLFHQAPPHENDPLLMRTVSEHSTPNSYAQACADEYSAVWSKRWKRSATECRAWGRSTRCINQTSSTSYLRCGRSPGFQRAWRGDPGEGDAERGSSRVRVPIS